MFQGGKDINMEIKDSFDEKRRKMKARFFLAHNSKDTNRKITPPPSSLAGQMPEGDFGKQDYLDEQQSKVFSDVIDLQRP